MLVDSACELVEPRSPFAEPRDELRLFELTQVTHRLDFHLEENRLGRFPDAGDLANGEGNEELVDLMRLDDEQPVRLAPVGCDLREELVRRDSRGRSEVRLFADLASYRFGCLGGSGNARELVRDVEVCLIER